MAEVKRSDVFQEGTQMQAGSIFPIFHLLIYLSRGLFFSPLILIQPALEWAQTPDAALTWGLNAKSVSILR
jgi:hypothetical protein